MRRLIVVEYAFALRGRGLAVVGPLDNPAGARYYVGDSVEVRVPGGKVHRTTIAGIPISPSRPGYADILLGPLAGEVGPGAEVWQQLAGDA